MEKSIVTMSKVIKDNKVYHNFYLFGVSVKPLKNDDFSKLYYQVKEYCRANGIDIPTIEKVSTKVVTDNEKK